MNENKKYTKLDKIFQHLLNYNILLQTYITTLAVNYFLSGDPGLF